MINDEINISHKSEETKNIVNSCTGWERLAQEISILLYCAVFEDDDMLLLIDGKEGAGKSLLGRKVCDLCKKLLLCWGVKINFSIDNIHFTTQEYMNASLEAKKKGLKGFPNLLDEARDELNRASAITKKSKKFTNFLSEIRDANQVHKIILPAFHDVDTSIVMWRQRLIIHVDKEYIKSKKTPTGYTLKRGLFRCFINNKFLKWAYFNSKIRYSYPRNSEFTGRFDAEDPIDGDAYIKKKTEHRETKYIEMAEEENGGKKEKLSYRIMDEVLKGDVDSGSIANKLGCSDNYVRNIMWRFRKRKK